MSDDATHSLGQFNCEVSLVHIVILEGWLHLCSIDIAARLELHFFARSSGIGAGISFLCLDSISVVQREDEGDVLK